VIAAHFAVGSSASRIVRVNFGQMPFVFAIEAFAVEAMRRGVVEPCAAAEGAAKPLPLLDEAAVGALVQLASLAPAPTPTPAPKPSETPTPPTEPTSAVPQPLLPPPTPATWGAPVSSFFGASRTPESFSFASSGFNFGGSGISQPNGWGSFSSSSGFGQPAVVPPTPAAVPPVAVAPVVRIVPSIPTLERTVEQAASSGIRAPAWRRGGRMRAPHLRETSASNAPASVRVSIGARVLVHHASGSTASKKSKTSKRNRVAGADDESDKAPTTAGDTVSFDEAAALSMLHGVVLAVDDETQRALVRVFDVALGLRAELWYRCAALKPHQGEPPALALSALTTTPANTLASQVHAEQRIGDATTSTVLHALLAHWPDEKPLSLLVDDDSQWVALLTLVAARFLRQEEAPERAGEREPVYKRLLSAEVMRLLRTENQRLVAADVASELAGANETSAEALLRRHAPLSCRLLEDCIAHQFWIASTTGDVSGSTSSSSSSSNPSFGLATWIMSLVTGASVVVGAHYAARVVDSFLSLATQGGVAALTNQRTQMFALLSHFVSGCVPTDDASGSKSSTPGPTAEVRQRARELYVGVFSSQTRPQGELCAIAELTLALHQRDWLRDLSDAREAGTAVPLPMAFTAPQRDVLSSLAQFDEMLQLVCNQRTQPATMQSTAKALADQLVDVDQFEFREISERIQGRLRVPALAGQSSSMFRVVVRAGGASLPAASASTFSNSGVAARLFECGSSEPFAVVRSLQQMSFISVPFAEFDFELCDAAAALAELRVAFIVAPATSRAVTDQIAAALPAVVQDAALMSDAARLVTEERPPASNSGFGRMNDDDDSSVRLPLLAFASATERSAQAHLYRAAAEAPRLRLCIAYALVRRLRQLATVNVARINFERHAFAGSLCERVLRARGLLGARVVNAVVSRLQAAAGIDTSSGMRPTVSVDRIGACTRANSVPTCFEQMATTLMRRPVTELRCAQRRARVSRRNVRRGRERRGRRLSRDSRRDVPRGADAAAQGGRRGAARRHAAQSGRRHTAAAAVSERAARRRGDWRRPVPRQVRAESERQEQRAPQAVPLPRLADGHRVYVRVASAARFAAARVEGAGRRRGDGQGSARHRPVLRPVARRHAPSGGEWRDARQL
jgi:hypothetical protein